MKTDKNQHITEYLDFYIALPQPPKFAVLIRGDWGCGKTWFVKNYLDTRSKPIEYIYVSLNGVSTIREIEDSIFSQTHPFLASKGMKVASKIFKGLLKTSLKIDLTKDYEANISSELPELDFKYLKLDNKLFVFDDLERCSLPIETILGYITQFVEDNGLKVILIANETEIESRDNSKYHFIKEKLIGRSFNLSLDFESTFDSFIAELNAETKSIIETKKALISVVFRKSNYSNLRYLRYAMLDFERLFSFLPDIAKQKHELLDHFIQIFFSIGFEIRKGEITEDDIPALDYIVNLHNNPQDKYRKILDKYDFYNNFNLIDFNIWVDYFKNGSVDKTALEISLKNSLYFDNENTPIFRKLLDFYRLDDTLFETYCSKLLIQFNDCQINSKEELLHITGELLYFSDLGLLQSVEKSQIIDVAVRNVQKLIDKKTFQSVRNEDLSLIYSFGYAYMSNGDEQFEQFKKFVLLELKRVAENNLTIAALSILESPINVWDTLFYEVGKVDGYYDTPLLSKIPMKEFIEKIASISNEEKYRLFAHVFRQRYKQGYFIYDLIDEIEWLKELHSKMCNARDKNKGKLSGYIYQTTIVPILESSIQNLEEAKRHQ